MSKLEVVIQMLFLFLPPASWFLNMKSLGLCTAPEALGVANKESIPTTPFQGIFKDRVSFLLLPKTQRFNYYFDCRATKNDTVFLRKPHTVETRKESPQ